MYKFLVIILFVLSVGVFGWTMHSYATSGEEIVSKRLQGPSGEDVIVGLDKSMSPVRIIFNVKSEMHAQDTTNPAYKYDVKLLDPVGTIVGSEARTQSEKKSDQGPSFERNNQNHIITTVNVDIDGDYRLQWKISPKKAKITGIGYSVRKNVEGMNIPFMLLAGGCFVLGWIVLIFGRR
ncbi:hypothetical protein GUA87_00070 [Sneathiella sp. P13V-1]|uniref:hypothetical protein n=1 Tax=Sneathiella sp. P13V-1 TaxID=2697366 RepID=UPI00187B7BE9|nr:hypothetical protein [Sneathiella sp. P13V-1]MBE7635223.1 hypothetical protein [Sneathiella sp. P13V-1]